MREKKKGLTILLNQTQHTTIKSRAVEKNMSIKDYLLKLVEQEIRENRGE